MPKIWKLFLIECFSTRVRYVLLLVKRLEDDLISFNKFIRCSGGVEYGLSGDDDSISYKTTSKNFTTTTEKRLCLRIFPNPSSITRFSSSTTRNFQLFARVLPTVVCLLVLFEFRSSLSRTQATIDPEGACGLTRSIYQTYASICAY